MRDPEPVPECQVTHAHDGSRTRLTLDLDTVLLPALLHALKHQPDDTLGEHCQIITESIEADLSSGPFWRIVAPLLKRTDITAQEDPDA